MKVKCKCGVIHNIVLNTSIYEVTGRPKTAGTLRCSNCGQENIVYVSIYHPTPISNTVPIEEMG